MKCHRLLFVAHAPLIFGFEGEPSAALLLSEGQLVVETAGLACLLLGLMECCLQSDEPAERECSASGAWFVVFARALSPHRTGGVRGDAVGI